MKLHQYQSDLVKTLSQNFREVKSVCVVLPTGGGKTVIAGDISQRLFRQMKDRKGVSCLYLVHRQELLWQTVATLRKFGLGDQVGIIAAGHGETPWAPLQVASVQTIARRLDNLTWMNPRMIFIDEAHHARAASWEKILAKYPNAYRLGLTATAERLDGKGLGAHFERLLPGPGIPWLVSNGYLAKVDTFTVPDGNTGFEGNGRMSNKEMDERADGPVIARAVDNIRKYAYNRRSIFYAVSIRHSHEVVEAVREIGISAEHVDGDTPTAKRENVMRRFSEGEVSFISNVGLFSEGLDVPECDCIIHGRPTDSITFYRQANGRAMRIKKDGRNGLVLDLAGNVHKHGLPDEEIEWSLEDGAVKQSVKAAQRNVRTCGDCGYDYPIRLKSCPLCGSVHKVRTAQEIDVELESVKEQKRNETKKRAGMTRAMNKEVYWSLGDRNKMREIARKYGRNPNIIAVWERVFRPMWNRHTRSRERFA